MNDNESTVIIVLGMHRSGTSVLTRALSELGVFLGGNLMSGLPDNPKGFFEDVDVVALNRKILKSASSSWHATVLPKVQNETFELYKKQAIDIIASNFGDASLFAIKDPRVTILQGFWCSVFDELNINIQYVLANRHPFSVSESISKRDGLHRNIGLILWLNYQLEGMKTILNKGGLVVNYEQLIDNPKRILPAINSFLKSPLSEFDIEKSEFVNNFIDGDLCHHNLCNTLSADCETRLEQVCNDFYKFIVSFCKDYNDEKYKKESELQVNINVVERYLYDKKEFLQVIDLLEQDNRILKTELKDSIRKFNQSQPFYKRIYWDLYKKINT